MSNIGSKSGELMHRVLVNVMCRPIGQFTSSVQMNRLVLARGCFLIVMMKFEACFAGAIFRCRYGRAREQHPSVGMFLCGLKYYRQAARAAS